MRFRLFPYGGIDFKILISIFGAGAVFLFLFLREAQAIKMTQQWPATEAVVVQHRTTTTTNLVQGRYVRVVIKHKLDFAFTYQVSGHNFSSQRFFPDAVLFEYTDAPDFPVGRHFLARYDPLAPEVAVAESGTLQYGSLVLAIVCFGLFVAGLIYNLRI